MCVLSDKTFLCFRVSLKIEPGDGSPRYASYKKELAGKHREELQQSSWYLVELTEYSLGSNIQHLGVETAVEPSTILGSSMVTLTSHSLWFCFLHHSQAPTLKKTAGTSLSLK